MSLVWRTLGRHRHWQSKRKKTSCVFTITVYFWNDFTNALPWLWLCYLISGHYWAQLQQGLYVECVRLCYHGAVKLIWVLEGDIMSWETPFPSKHSRGQHCRPGPRHGLHTDEVSSWISFEIHIFCLFHKQRPDNAFLLSSWNNEKIYFCILASRKNLISLERAQ